ncbi:MAG: M23 family metallopeptidase [Chitinophagaceae bacterium]
MRLLIAVLFFLISSTLLAQESGLSDFNVEQKINQSGFFSYPLDIIPKLNANFGEMRPNHFHMGLDLFTAKRENLPVFAAAEGFVSRVKIEAGGFGNAIYIDHPNGFTTLYAHMNGFAPQLEQYIKKEQYKMESWAIDLTFPPHLFPVKKGEWIGLSGNTGASQGPHVHFEIRETKSEKCVNPLLFDFNLADNIAPDIFSLAFYDRSKSVYEQFPVLVPVVRNKNEWIVKVPDLPFKNVGVAFRGSDRMNGNPNPNGIYGAALFENKKIVTGFSLDKMGYDETRYLNAHIDHMFKMKSSGYLQSLFPLYGDKPQIYIGGQKISGISLHDGKSHDLILEVRDIAGNKSRIAFSVKSRADAERTIPIVYKGQLMIPDQVNIFDSDSIEWYMPEGSIYDSIHFQIQSKPSTQLLSFSKSFVVHDSYVPLHKYCNISIKPDKVIPYPLRDRMIIRKITQSNISVKKANWGMGKYGATFREFGIFELIADQNPPTITAAPDGANLSAVSRIVIRVNDDYETIKNFKATLDGHWLRFSQRNNSFTYVFDELCPSGEHELKIFVEDEAGNPAEKIIHFKR